MSFLVPLFFAGMALLVVPWLVHRIRRPERELVRFSSLMFVPDIKREVIERRRVQHVLLMLLRMLLLALLVLAFSRPFREVFFGGDAPTLQGTYHVILLDASLSMGRVWDEAQQKARDILGDVAAGDGVGVIRFAQSVYVDAPLSDDVAMARQAIEASEWTWEKGDDLVGLQAAAQMAGEDQSVRRVVYLISDFQASGLPEEETGWALPRDIQFQPMVIGKGDWPNASVDALAIRRVGDEALQVRARVKNWQGSDALTVRLWVDGAAKDVKTMSVPAGHASQVRFDLPSRAVSGFVGVDTEDGLTADNRRFFTWELAAKYQVLVLGGKLEPLMKAAVPDDAVLPWQIQGVEAADFAGALKSEPAVVVAGRVDDLNASSVTALADYVRRGGKLFLPLQKGADPAGVNAILNGSGVHVALAKATDKYVPVSWVDLKHRIFYPFRGAKFNDFSSVRYADFHQVFADSGQVLARFEGDAVAMVASRLGQGRVLVWAGGLEMDRSNLARTPRFVPLVHETLRFLAGEQDALPIYAVGDGIQGDDGDLVQAGRFVKPGIYEPEGKPLAAVQVDARESDPVQVTTAEFEIRLCDAPVIQRHEDGTVKAVIAHDKKQEEYGYWILAVMFGFLLVEQVYAAWIEDHPKGEHA